MNSTSATGRREESSARKIAFFGLFGGTNLGNEATLAAMLANVRMRIPDMKAACVSPKGSPVETLHGASHIELDPLPISQYLWRIRHTGIKNLAYRSLQIASEPARMRRSMRALSDADLFVVPGTGIADDFGQGPLDLPLHLSRWCTAAHRSGIPIRFASIGAGPAEHWLSRRLIKNALGKSDYCTFRDFESADFARNLGILSGEKSEAPDLAFSLPTDQLPAFGPNSWPPRVVGIGLMGYFGWNKQPAEGELVYQDYLAKIKDLCLWLIEKGYAIRLLIGDTRADVRVCEDILSWAKQVPDREISSRLSCPPIATYGDLLRELAATDIVIASRFHNLLLALLIGRPAISLSYARKNDQLMIATGFGGYTHRIEEFSVTMLTDSFSRCVSGTDPELTDLRAKIDTFRAELDSQYDDILR